MPDDGVLHITANSIAGFAACGTAVAVIVLCTSTLCRLNKDCPGDAMTQVDCIVCLLYCLGATGDTPNTGGF